MREAEFAPASGVMIGASVGWVFAEVPAAADAALGVALEFVRIGAEYQLSVGHRAVAEHGFVRG